MKRVQEQTAEIAFELAQLQELCGREGATKRVIEILARIRGKVERLEAELSES